MVREMTSISKLLPPTPPRDHEAKILGTAVLITMSKELSTVVK